MKFLLVPTELNTHTFPHKHAHIAWPEQTHPAPLVMPAALSKLIRERASSQPFTQLIVFHRAVSPNQTEHHFSGKTTEDSSLQLSQPITDSSEHTTPVAINVTHTTTVASICQIEFKAVGKWCICTGISLLCLIVNITVALQS